MTGEVIPNEKYMRLLSFIDLPDDERKITENGLSLSVGQRKKLLFMQMLLRSEKASVIIMDEVTAGLDADTTKKLNEHVKSLAAQGNKIIIFVDHSLVDDLPITKKLTFNDGYIEKG